MPSRRILTAVAVALFAGIVVLCITYRREPGAGRLLFVGNDRPWSKHLSGTGLVIATHGWIKKGKGGWPEDMAVAIYNCVDPNMWLCGYFDWSEGARSVNPTDAAKYARDVAGLRLAEEIMRIRCDLRHIHLIGHSSGCWAISEAAKILVRETRADLHLTFLDAYVPAFWDQSLLGDVNAPNDVNCWAEHYYTRDLTLSLTHQDLRFAHNVDITSMDGVLRDHNFPWQWYHGTVSRRYARGGGKPVISAGSIEYGFARSREATGSDGWSRSLRLPVGNKAMKLRSQ